MTGVKRGAALLVLLATACREIPPAIPEGYTGSPAADGWPPPAVYDPDPFHPANRWFHRAFGGRAPAGDVLAPRGDEPFPRLARPSRVDIAELGALLDECARLPEPLEGALFRADLLAEASRASAEGSAEFSRDLGPLLLAAARHRGASPAETRALPDPPPLREGVWKEEPPPGAPGLLPSPEDLRWTRRFRSATGERAALIRLAAALGPDGAPGLSRIPSECWELSFAGGAPEARVWRFDRALWTAGRDPWREIGPAERIAIRDPLRSGGVLEGEIRSLCGTCHSSRGAPPARPDAPRPQEDLVREALEDALGPSAD